MTPIDTLRRVRAALPVLQTMLTKAGLLQGATIASEHLADLDAAIAALSAPEASGAKFTTGHCDNHKQAGGCQLHNLQCGWPKCDQRPITNPSSPTSGVDWRSHYIEVTAMRYMDNGLHRAAAMKAAEREARSMEAMAGTMQTVTMPTPADESGASGDVARWRRHDPEIEREAEAIYNAMPFNEPGQKPAWVPHGNSLKQDEARDAARLARGGSHD